MIRSSDAISILLAAPLALLSACGSPSSSGGAGTSNASEPTGQVSLAITTVPAGVQCIQVTATGSTTVSQTFSVTPDAGTVSSLALGELPIGSVVITAQAYSVACASIATASPSWVADKQTISIGGGQAQSVTITFRPDTSVTGTANFVAPVVNVDIGVTTIGLVIGDGSVRGAGNGPPPWVNGYSNFASETFLSGVSQLAISQGTTLSPGGPFACVTRSGAVACWGDDTFGELGNGAPAGGSSTVPVAVQSTVVNVVELCAGSVHACALESSGQVYCWGYNSAGQVGSGSPSPTPTPTLVVSGASSVACGYVSTCAIVNGVVECLGDNTYGEIGQGTTISSYGSATPVSSLNAMKQVAIGFGHACAVRNDGAAFCWGYNAYGQLGIGSFANQSTPVAVSSLSNIQQMALSLYATCARRGDGTVWCWGYDADGEVGDGTGNKTGITLPVQVQGLPPSASIVAGQQDICSIGTDSTINCWGGNAGSQLGNNTTNSAWVPAPLTL